MKCRLCGNEKLKLYYSQGNKDQYKFYKCNVCGLVNYDLTHGQDQAKYSTDSYTSPYDNKNKQNSDQISSYNFFRKYVKTAGNLFDVGCGNGKFLLLARESGWNVRGLELSEFLAHSINDKFGIEVIVSDFQTYKPDNIKFDAVILRHVLEHLSDPVLTMKKINSLLNPGGYSLIEFPDIESCEFKLKRFLNKSSIHKKKYKESYMPGHCNEFSQKAFQYLVDLSGFELIKWQNYSSKRILNYFYKYTHFGTKARVLIRKKQ
jgi:SAM-dependent methyltransferase